MKFLLDVCVSSRSLIACLEGRKHDVVSITSHDPQATDATILKMACEENRTIVTEDKDFGELIFVQGMAHGPLIRLVELTVDEQVEAMNELLDNYASQMVGRVLITVSRGRIRIRR